MPKVTLTDPGHAERTGKRTRRDIMINRVYTVALDDGTVVGTVAYEMQTFERRTAGKTYVNSRWRSPRWFFYPTGVHRRSFECSSKKQAVDALLDIASRQRSE